MAEVQVLDGWATGDAPLVRISKPGETYEVLAVDATFDGSGAGGDFVPAVQIVSDAGREVGTFPLAAAVAMGDSAKVTFAPFLRDGTGLTGIYFNRNNVGGYLEINAPDTGNFKVGGPVNGNVAAWSVGITGTGLVGIGSADDIYILTDHALLIRGDTSDQEFSGQYLLHPDEFLVTADSDIELDAGTFGFSMSSKGNWSVDLTGGTGSAFVTLPAGGKLEVQDHNGAAIFRVNENGSLQGKTGQTLTFNL